MATKLLFAGRERTLKFLPSTMRDFEQAHPGSFLDVVSTFGYSTLQSLLYLGLQHEDKGLTPKKVMEYIDQHVIQGGDAIADLWMPLQKELAMAGIFGETGKAKAQEEAAQVAG